MSGPQTPQQSSAMWPTVWISAVLAAGACTVDPVGCDGVSARRTSRRSSRRLLLSVAHQIESGPRGLYGPYDGRYPLVLIHAPLYYRLAALVGWPLLPRGLRSRDGRPGRGPAALGTRFPGDARGGLPPGTPGRHARQGRGVGRSARRRHTDLWRHPVRGPARHAGDRVPDDRHPAGARGTRGRRRSARRKLNAAAACFAVAVCIKQQYVVAPLVSLVLMSGARARGRLGLAAILRFVSIASASTLLYYGAEEWITGGPDVAVGLRRRPERGPGSPGGLVVRRQSSSGTHLEVRGPDSSAGGRRTGDGIGPAAGRRGGRS